LPNLDRNKRRAFRFLLTPLGMEAGDWVPADGRLLSVTSRRRLTSRRCAKNIRASLEVPFGSDYKLMATFHDWTNEDGRKIVRCFVKGRSCRSACAMSSLALCTT
jgi:magnesium-transporting ATPase (P-type)